MDVIIEKWGVDILRDLESFYNIERSIGILWDIQICSQTQQIKFTLLISNTLLSLRQTGKNGHQNSLFEEVRVFKEGQHY